MKPPTQFDLPKSNRMLPPKKVNKVLDDQSDAAVGVPVKGKTTFGPAADKTTQDMVNKAKAGKGTLTFKPKR